MQKDPCSNLEYGSGTTEIVNVLIQDGQSPISADSELRDMEILESEQSDEEASDKNGFLVITEKVGYH